MMCTKWKGCKGCGCEVCAVEVVVEGNGVSAVEAVGGERYKGYGAREVEAVVCVCARRGGTRCAGGGQGTWRANDALHD